MPPRAQHYFQPQLAQFVTTTPSAAYAVVRLSKAYLGPTVRVRRASDNTEQDCKSQADISSFCAGTNGFIRTFYDQSGNGRDQVQTTQAQQPKVFDSVTGLLVIGSTPVISSDGVDDNVGIAGSTLGFGGAPDMTFAMLTKFDGTLAAQSGSQQVGWGNVAAPDGWQCEPRADLTQWVPRWVTVVERFTPNPAVTVWQYIVTLIAAGANGNTLVCRTNKNALTNATPGAGVPTINTGSDSRIFCELNTSGANTNFYLGRIAVVAYYQDVLAGDNLNGLEQALEALRVQ